MSLSEFAKEIGLTRDQVSNIERGRSPLRYVNAVRALAADGRSKTGWPYLHPFNPLWLFGEDWPTQLSWPMLLPDPVSIGLSLTLRFSDFVADNLALLQVFASDTPRNARLPESWLQLYLHHWTGLHLKADRAWNEALTVFDILGPSALDLARVSPPARRVLQVVKKTSLGLGWLDSERDRAGNPEDNPLSEKESSKRVLTSSSESVILPPMKSELQELLGAARRLTKSRGMKTRLAKDLAVPLPRVSDWLAGNYLPSGKRALQLREWVHHAQEVQQNQSPGSATTPPGRKTQSKASNEKKPKSSPQER